MTKTEGRIFNIQRYCLHDGPGIRTAVFLKGCPLDCPWCHNPESKVMEDRVLFFQHKCIRCGSCLESCPARKAVEDGISFSPDACLLCGKCVDRCPTGANERCGKTVTVEEVMQTVVRDKKFYETSGGGLTISGGEPSLQPNFTLALLEEAKNEKIATAVETCGYGPADFFDKAAKLGALFLFDIKNADPDKHKALTGKDNALILSNLRFLTEKEAPLILRLPLIPKKNDSEDDLRRLVSLIAEFQNKILYAEIMPYHNLGITKEKALGKISPETIEPGEKYAEEWKRILEKSGCEIRISGI